MDDQNGLETKVDKLYDHIVVHVKNDRQKHVANKFVRAKKCPPPIILEDRILD